MIQAFSSILQAMINCPGQNPVKSKGKHHKKLVKPLNPRQYQN